MKQLDVDPFGAPDAPFLNGGPNEPGCDFVLRLQDFGRQDTFQFIGLGAMTGTIDVRRAIAHGRGASSWLVALGYAAARPTFLLPRYFPTVFRTENPTRGSWHSLR